VTGSGCSAINNSWAMGSILGASSVCNSGTSAECQSGLFVSQAGVASSTSPAGNYWTIVQFTYYNCSASPQTYGAIGFPSFAGITVPVGDSLVMVQMAENFTGGVFQVATFGLVVTGQISCPFGPTSIPLAWTNTAFHTCTYNSATCTVAF
jgi:hypothetical protein